MKKPSFFIVGAPKCGTTSLYNWVSSHDGVYMSPVKEPCYFNTDDGHTNVRSIEQYESLFEDVKGNHKAVGEASVWYLQSKEAIENIKKYNPDSKFVICVRDPIEMAVSLHEQQLFSGNEYIESFEKAWRAQIDRKGGRKLSVWTREPKHLIYGDICRVGLQIENVLKYCNKKDVKIIFLEDIKENPEKVYSEVLKFIGVEDKNEQKNFTAKNKGGKVRKSRVLRILSRSIHMIKNYMGVYKGMGIGKKIYDMNTKRKKRSSIDEGLKQEMKKYFRKDIIRLEKITKRDLSCWY